MDLKNIQKNRRTLKNKVRTHSESREYRGTGESDEYLPKPLRDKLHLLFDQIEKEFENLYMETLTLQDKLEISQQHHEKPHGLEDAESSFIKSKKSSQTTQLINTTRKLKAQTSKIVSSFKPPVLQVKLVRSCQGHRDGVWDVAVSKTTQNIFATASADNTAVIWSLENGACILRYIGHAGSVNSIRFHPTQDLVVTGSGDQTAHIWRTSTEPLEAHRPPLSDDGIDLSDKESSPNEEFVVQPQVEHFGVIRTPLCELRGHSRVVSAADWMATSDHVITASWDRTANMYDAATGELLHQLVGHDAELTNVTSHATQRLIVTSAKDSTFRLWDFRDPVHSVSVFQGHNDAVTSTVFFSGDKLASGSDDRCIKLWDLKNMRTALTTIRTDAPVNRLSVSNNQVIVAPHDNRFVSLYDSHGARLSKFPRGSSRQGHRRMVTCSAWADDIGQGHCQLLTAGFDRMVLGWNVTPSSQKD